MAWNPFKRRGANNAANPPANNPPANNPQANAAGNQQGAAANAGNSQGRNTFGSRMLVVSREHKKKAGALLVLIFALMIYGLYRMYSSSLTWAQLFALIVGSISTIALVISFFYIIYQGLFNPEEEDKQTAGFIAVAFIIWLIDLIPAGIPGFGWLGKPYAGFEFDLIGTLNTSWGSVMTSVIMFAALFFIGMRYLTKKKNILMFMVIFLIAGLLARLSDIYFFASPRISWAYLNYIVLGIVVIIFALAFYYRRSLSGDFVDLSIYMFMAIVFSFFYVNDNWMYNRRALLHFIFILAFGFGYIWKREESDSTKYLLIPGLLLLDFYGASLLNLGPSQFSLMGYVPFIPLLVLFVVFYSNSKSDSSYIQLATIFLLVILFISIFPKNAIASASMNFESVETGDYKNFLKEFNARVKSIIENRLDVATGGLYRGNVEKNQYESLGVYFGNVRAADPKFFEDDPITVWGTIRSKTYSDAVIINYSCYRWKGNTKIPADKIIPDIHFPIFTLEEVDTECTFYPKRDEDDAIEPGPNTVTLSANYNFGTDAYLKSYFIDRDRFRANTRENIDPLSQYGIKDKNPVAVFTNGPVEIGMGTGQPLITVTDGYLIQPSIDITLRNREQLHDQEKNIITKWDGRIKNITELVLLVPPGIEIPNVQNCGKEDATDIEKADCPCNVPFAEYKVDDCKSSCESSIDECRKACIDSYGQGAASSCGESGCGQCIKECEITLSRCNNECSFLFSAEPDDQSLQGDYLGYRLLVDSKEFEEYNKDIETARSFRCRFNPSTKVLDSTPITTRYFRVRAKYNYAVENSVQINVQPSLMKAAGINTEDLLFRTSIGTIDNEISSEMKSQGFSPDLIMAIAYVETGMRHCCQDKSGTTAASCARSEERRCDQSNIISSGSSIGLMQIRYDNDKVRAEVNSRAQRVCGSGQDIYDLECNIKVGIDILKEKYNTYKDGCKSTSIWKQWEQTHDAGIANKYPTFLKACEEGTTTGKIDNKIIRYDSYRNIDAAIRGYNGWGISANYDRDYVTRVNRAAENIKAGRITDPLKLKLYFASRTGTGMTLLDEDAPSAQDINLPTLNLQGTYDPSTKKVKLTWDKSPKTDTAKYRIERQAPATAAKNICEKVEDGTPVKECPDDIEKAGITYTYYAYVITNSGDETRQDSTTVATS